MSAEWFYTQNGQQQGPITREELKQLAHGGRLQPTDMIWKEGMPNWAKANSATGLFPTGASASSPTRSEPEPAYRDEPRSRPDRYAPRASGEYDDDGDDYDYERRRPSRRRKKGTNPALLWGLIGGGVALVLIVGLVIYLIVGRESGNSRSFSLNKNAKTNYRVEFKKGNWVEVNVKSKGKSDVDLYVYDSSGRRIASDTSFSSNCRVKFFVTKTQRYKVELWNRILPSSRDGHNSGTVSWTITSPNQVAGKNKNGNGPPPPGGGRRPPFTLAGTLTPGPTIVGNRYYQVYDVFLDANRTYTIDMKSAFDNFLYLKDTNGRTIRSNDDGPFGLNAQIVYRPVQTRVYRIYATSLGSKRSGPFTLTVR